MELHNLKPAPNATHRKKRIGRGEGSKKGGTSTKGHKGQQSRAGYSRKLGFEGGQTPRQRRIPKFGNLKRSKPSHIPISLETIAQYAQKHDTTHIDQAFLLNTRLLRKKTHTYKILGTATLPQKLTIHAHGFSQTALDAIQKQGGTSQIL